VDGKLRAELASFSSLWRNGYFNNVNRNKGPRHLRRVAQYLQRLTDSSTVALEIGCGRGAWTKKMLSAAHIYCLDALSAEHNRFWEYVGKSHSDQITYVKVEDFLLTEIPDDSVDLVFSYDCFCHISYTGTQEYLRNLHRKLRDGANGLIMVADYDRYIGSGEAPGVTPIYPSITEEIHDFDGPPYPGRWYWYGLDRFCGALEEFGYRVIERDIGIDERDPICLFSK
jgi:Methyltransferase domain